MLIEIFDNKGNLVKVDAEKFCKDAASRYQATARVYGVGMTFQDALDEVVKIADSMQPLVSVADIPDYHQIEMSRRGWYGGTWNAEDGYYTFLSNAIFVSGRIQRKVKADNLADAIKSLKRPRG